MSPWGAVVEEASVPGHAEDPEDHGRSYTETAMTRQQLHAMVEGFSDAELDPAAESLAQFRGARPALTGVYLSDKPATWPPKFSGIMRSSKSDLAAGFEDILREEFGRPA
jgi:hypothetical protein